jgi:hypothetical protein
VPTTGLELSNTTDAEGKGTLLSLSITLPRMVWVMVWLNVANETKSKSRIEEVLRAISLKI